MNSVQFVIRCKQVFCILYRMLLWHGSRLTNWAGILTQGLRIAPPEAPVTGYMVCRVILKPVTMGP